MVKVGFVSDLHLEFRDPHHKLFRDVQEGDVLLVAGDFCMARYMNRKRTDEKSRSVHRIIDKVQKEVFSKYQRVLYVAGNHEHYDNVFHWTVNNIKEFFAGTNVTVMDDDVTTYGDVVFIGSTLWSDYFRGNPVSMEACRNGMADYSVIYREELDGLPITPDMLLKHHTISRDFINMATNAYSNNKMVVMTHHGPTLKSLHPDHCGNGLDGGYCSDLSDLILDHPNIKAWIHGHTHLSVDYLVGDTRILANQCGYRGEASYADFKGVRQFDVI